jgi:hypothetical protein
VMPSSIPPFWVLIAFQVKIKSLVLVDISSLLSAFIYQYSSFFAFGCPLCIYPLSFAMLVLFDSL